MIKQQPKLLSELKLNCMIQYNIVAMWYNLYHITTICRIFTVFVKCQRREEGAQQNSLHPTEFNVYISYTAAVKPQDFSLGGGVPM